MKICLTIFSGLALLLGMWAVFGLFIAPVVMVLWNAVIPSVLGLQVLTYWQAYLLYLLCAILFKSSSTSSSKD